MESRLQFCSLGDNDYISAAVVCASKSTVHTYLDKKDLKTVIVSIHTYLAFSSTENGRF